MNEIVKLYKDNPVRIIEKDGEPWFVAKDVAAILGYRDAYTLVRRLDDALFLPSLLRKQHRIRFVPS